MQNKLKGQGTGSLNLLISATIVLLVVGVVIAFSLVFLSQANVSIAAMSGNTDAAQSAITSTISAIAQIPTWLPLVVLAIIMVVVLGLVLYIGFMVSRMQGGGYQ